MANKPVEVWRVLLVDDDEDDYLITYSMLSQAKGRKVALEWAPTFEDGQRLLETDHYTAVLVDYDLGLRTGIELIRETVARGYPAPLILYTGRGGYEVDLEAMQAGATLYLSKTEATTHLLERSLRYAIERKRIEAELDRRLQERSHILESIQDGFFAIDRDWRITYINRRAAQNGGFEPEELLGQVIWEAFPRLHGTSLEETYRYVMNERIPVQFEMQGVYQGIWYNISIYPSAEGISVFWQDITARKQAEQEMRVANELLQEQAEELELQAEELRTQTEELANANEQIRLNEEIARQRLKELEDLYHTAPVGLCVLDTQLRWVRINERLAEINGLPAAAHIGKRVQELLPHLAKEVEPRMRRVLETGEPQTGIEITSETPSQPGVQRSWLESWLPIMDSTGKATGLSIVVEETTERKRAERELAHSQAQLQTIFENLNEGLIVSNLEGELVHWNRAALEMHGFTNQKEFRRRLPEFADTFELAALDGTVLPVEGWPMARVLRGERVRDLELRIRRLNSDWRRVYSYSGSLVRDAQGQPLMGVLTVYDVSEREQREKILRAANARLQEQAEELEVQAEELRVQAEELTTASEQMRKSQALLQAVTDNTPDAIFLKDEQSRLLMANPATLQIFGKPAEQVLGKTDRELYRDPEVGRLIMENDRRVMELGRTETLEETVQTPQGYRVFLSTKTPWRSASGRVVGLVGVSRDITEHRQADEALRRYELLSANSRDIILFMRREDGRILEANAAAAQAYGYSREELLEMTIQDLRAPDTRGLTSGQMAQADTGGILFETSHRRKDGSTFPVEVSSQGATITGQRTLISVIRDITERIQSEQALRSSQQDLARAQAVAHTGSWRLDVRQNQLLWSDETYRIFGIPKGTPMTYEAFLAAIHPEDRDFVERSWAAALRGEPYDIEHRIVAGDQVKWVRERTELEFDRQGVLLGGFGTVQDISEQKRAVAALRESEDRFRSLFNGMTEGFAIHEVITTEDGRPYDYRFLDINPAFERMTGLRRDDVLGRTHNEVLPDNDPKWVRIYGEVALTGKPVHFEEYSPALKRHYEVFAYRPALNQFAVIFMDITERKQAEQDLQAYAEKLQRSNEALEDFAFIASHDLREPLRKVQAFGDLLESRSSQGLDEQARDYIARMQAAAGRMESMLDGLLAYSRVTTQGRPFIEVDLHQIAKDVLSDLELRVEQTGGKVTIQHLPVIEADPLQMRQLLQNLLGNALKFHRPHVPPQVVISYWVIAEKRIELSIEDNGIGFDMGMVDQLFQPFHRLIEKSSYEGTGMGLAICRKIVERHRGSISARSEPGKGSTFLVTLPCESCS